MCMWKKWGVCTETQFRLNQTNLVIDASRTNCSINRKCMEQYLLRQGSPVEFICGIKSEGVLHFLSSNRN